MSVEQRQITFRMTIDQAPTVAACMRLAWIWAARSRQLMDVAAAPVASADGSAAEADGGALSSSGNSTTVAPSSASSRSPSATDGPAASAGGASEGSDCTCAAAASPPKMAACTPEEHTVIGTLCTDKLVGLCEGCGMKHCWQAKLDGVLLCADEDLRGGHAQLCTSSKGTTDTCGPCTPHPRAGPLAPPSKQLEAAHAVMSRAAAASQLSVPSLLHSPLCVHLTTGQGICWRPALWAVVVCLLSGILCTSAPSVPGTLSSTQAGVHTHSPTS